MIRRCLISTHTHTWPPAEALSNFYRIVQRADNYFIGGFCSSKLFSGGILGRLDSDGAVYQPVHTYRLYYGPVNQSADVWPYWPSWKTNWIFLTSYLSRNCNLLVPKTVTVSGCNIRRLGQSQEKYPVKTTGHLTNIVACVYQNADAFSYLCVTR